MNSQTDFELLFRKLYEASTETEIDRVIQQNNRIFKSENWCPLGGIKNNFGVVENQQSSPIAALIEKITNSIDSILIRKCIELNIDPKSSYAPASMKKAIEEFFPEHKNWDLPKFRGTQQNSYKYMPTVQRRIVR